jgi:nucleoside-triphosphatase
VTRLLIEARPGAGKTTAIGRLAQLLDEAGIALGGFFTRELRESGRRVGFEVEAFAGERGLLAHVDLEAAPRVGRYRVDVEAFERIALPALGPPYARGVTTPGAVLIDELGKMELLSDLFAESVLALFERPVPIVATVHTAKHPFTDALKRRPDVSTVRLTAANRDRLPEELVERLVGSRPGVPG